MSDLRYALRLIRKTPVASIVAILTVAIGVGANTAIFSIIRAVLITTFLFGVVPSDPRTLAGVAGLLAVVADAACYLPARQAVKVDPLVALKTE